MRIRPAVPLAVVTLVACNFQFHASTSTGSGVAPGGRAERSGAPRGFTGLALPDPASFALAVDGKPELLSRFDMAPGSSGPAICRWQAATGVRAHLGGGKYGDLTMEWGYARPTDEFGPCDALAAKAPPVRDLLALAKRDCADCMRGARWATDGWTVQMTPEGNPVRQVRDAQILKVVRKAGPVHIAPLDPAVLTSAEMKQQIAHACQYPPVRTPCSIDSATVDHVVRFYDDDHEKYPTYEVFSKIHVHVGGETGVCEMRVVVDNIDGKIKVNDGQCRYDANDWKVANWDERCSTLTCMHATAKLH